MTHNDAVVSGVVNPVFPVEERSVEVINCTNLGVRGTDYYGPGAGPYSGHAPVEGTLYC